MRSCGRWVWGRASLMPSRFPPCFSPLSLFRVLSAERLLAALQGAGAAVPAGRGPGVCLGVLACSRPLRRLVQRWAKPAGVRVATAARLACRLLHHPAQAASQHAGTTPCCGQEESRQPHLPAPCSPHFAGKVVSFDESSRADREMFCTHRVEYEDGDVEDLHLAQELFSLRPPPEWTQQQQPEEQQQEPGQQQQEPGQQQEQQQEPGPGQRGAGVQQATAEDSEGDQEQRQQASGSPGTCAAAAAPRRRGKKRRHRGTPVPRGHGQQAQAGLPVQPAAAAAAVDLPAPLHQAGPPAPQQQPAAAAAAGPPRSLADRMAAAIQACQQQPAAVDAGLSSTVWEEYLGKWQGFDPAVQGSALNVVEQVLKEGQFAILSVIVDDLPRGLA